jgi:hypothetical protein
MGVRGGRSLALKSIMNTALAHKRMLHIDAAPVNSVFILRHYATPENVPDFQYMLPGRDVDVMVQKMLEGELFSLWYFLPVVSLYSVTKGYQPVPPFSGFL